MWICFTVMGNAIAQFWNDEWRTIISVASPFIALILAYYLGKLRRWWEMRNPIKVTYLIPKEKYREISYPGAGSDEKTPNELVIGIGYYRVMHLIIPKREIDIGAIKLRFRGPNENKPISRGEDNPYWIEEISSRSGQPSPSQYINWEGEVYPFPDLAELPLHLIKNVPLYIGNAIETTGAWEGEIILHFPIYKWRMIEKSLKFRVMDGGSDDIPFLEGKRNRHGKHKEIQEREDSKQKTISSNS